MVSQQSGLELQQQHDGFTLIFRIAYYLNTRQRALAYGLGMAKLISICSVVISVSKIG